MGEWGELPTKASSKLHYPPFLGGVCIDWSCYLSSPWFWDPRWEEGIRVALPALPELLPRGSAWQASTGETWGCITFVAQLFNEMLLMEMWNQIEIQNLIEWSLNCSTVKDYSAHDYCTCRGDSGEESILDERHWTLQLLRTMIYCQSDRQVKQGN